MLTLSLVVLAFAIGLLIRTHFYHREIRAIVARLNSILKK